MNKRIAILVTYDAEGIIDRYVGYLLNELRLCCDKVVVVCNNKNIHRGLDIIKEHASDVFFRDNIGYDAGGFKDALCSFIGWDEIREYDELVLVNDSFFGPFVPLKSIFADMDSHTVDFWGLLKHEDMYLDSKPFITEHIQTYFIVIRKEMLSSPIFVEFWESMPYYDNFIDVIINYELCFTSHFGKNGFDYLPYADNVFNESDSIYNTYNPYSYLSYELIKKRKYPILKRQSVKDNTLFCQTQENCRQSLEYIKNNTPYDISLIWEHLIRTTNVSTMFNNFCLSYAITKCENILNLKDDDICICVYINHGNSFEYVIDYLDTIKELCHVSIYACEAELLMPYSDANYHCVEIASPDVYLPYVNKNACEFQYICLIHDVDMSSMERMSRIGKSHFHNIWSNLIGSGNHIMNIKGLFMDNPHLGFLSPPMPDFAELFGDYGRGWNGKYDQISEAVNVLGVSCVLSKDNPPFTVTSAFWMRRLVLRTFFEKADGLARKDEGIYSHILPYLWLYITQDAGYYSGLLMSDDFAAMEFVNKKYYMDKVTGQIREQLGGFENFNDLQTLIFKAGVSLFAQKHKEIYIYGIGDMAKQHPIALHNLAGYIVSDGKEKPKMYNGLPVKYLSEANLTADDGIIVCMDKKHQAEIIPILNNKGITNYLCL